MRVLVTGDDGVDAPGLAALAAHLTARGHTVTVAAPRHDCSGSGTAIGPIVNGSRVRVDLRPAGTFGPAPVYVLDCPPTLGVLAFCSGTFGPRPDLVVSGVNEGYNTGRSVLFSSTVAAVLAAGVSGVGGIAVSTDFDPQHGFGAATDVCGRLIDRMRALERTDLTLNVNVPDVPAGAATRVLETSLGGRSMFSLRLARSDDGFVVHRAPAAGFTAGTDTAAVHGGAVSVTGLGGLGRTGDQPLPPGIVDADPAGAPGDPRESDRSIAARG